MTKRNKGMINSLPNDKSCLNIVSYVTIITHFMFYPSACPSAVIMRFDAADCNGNSLDIHRRL